MKPTSPGEKIVDSVVVSNNSAVEQCFSIVLPDSKFTWVKISPMIAVLAPGKAARLEIEYFPPKNVDEIEPSKWHRDLVDTSATSPFETWKEESGWIYAQGKYGEIQWTQLSHQNSANQQDENTGDIENIISAATNPDEWGIYGKLKFPIVLKQQSQHKDHHLNTVDMPLYLCLNTVVIKPDFVVETSVMDFGQMAVATRTINTLRIRNLSSSRAIDLQFSGINAVGPFSVINASRSIVPGGWHTLIIECFPMNPGLIVELLQISAKDGGPHITVTLRVQGVNPVIEVSGIQKVPGWSTSLGGLLDFDNVLALDQVVKKYTINNKSQFPVEATIQRAVCQDVLPLKQSEMIQRTVSGLPIFSYRPEFAVIPQGGSVDVEVIFRPDRARFFPFREDFNILVGKGDNPIRITAFGRAWSRQLFIRTIDPYDEPFIKKPFGDETDEDLLLSHFSPQVRNHALSASQAMGIGKMNDPSITLEYPDPFASGIETQNPTMKDTDTVRAQTRQIAVCCANVHEPRLGSSPGTFEVKLDKCAVDSKYFTIVNDKGNVPIGGEVFVSITCTLPRPHGLGDLEVGSWQCFSASVTLKGGWRPDGDEAIDVVIPILLNVYVRL
jgi:hypothetical protein